MKDTIVTPDPKDSILHADQTVSGGTGHGCSCGSAEPEGRKQPVNIFNEIAYLTEHMSNLGEEEVQRILDEFLAENDASDVEIS